ncbi:phosphotransferase, partial [Tsukamurella paurometabola]
LAEAVTGAPPAHERRGLIHGDYCPLNIMGTVDGPPRVAAVLDWETAAAGDPLVDLAYLTARWVTPEEDPLMAAFTLGGGDPAAHALLPQWTALAGRYAAATGRDLTDLPRYQGLAMLRLATALEGRVAASARRGNEAMRAGFAAMADTAARRGLTLMEQQ